MWVEKEWQTIKLRPDLMILHVQKPSTTNKDALGKGRTRPGRGSPIAGNLLHDWLT